MAFFSRAEKAATLLAVVTPVIASSLLLGGCMSSPTYGTDKSANEQLLTDVTDMVSLAPKRRGKIDYKPRPDLVRPATTRELALPPPQENIAAGNPDWPEAPEQQRARLHNEITEKENSGDMMSRSGESRVAAAEVDLPIIADEDMADGANSYTRAKPGAARSGDSGVRPESERVEQREEVKKRLTEARQGSATSRKYLSEPPLAYREAAASAPQDDIGDDEYKKERRAKAAARKKGSSTWRNWLPDF